MRILHNWCNSRIVIAGTYLYRGDLFVLDRWRTETNGRASIGLLGKAAWAGDRVLVCEPIPAEHLNRRTQLTKLERPVAECLRHNAL